MRYLSAEPAFHKKVAAWRKPGGQATSALERFQQDHPQSPLRHVVHFSMEFMLSEALSIFSGGLAVWLAIS